jgi:hypothetical protein
VPIGARHWRSSLADNIVGSIVMSRFLKIPREANLREEANKIVDEVRAVMLRFADFCGEFIWRFCED